MVGKSKDWEDGWAFGFLACMNEWQRMVDAKEAGQIPDFKHTVRMVGVPPNATVEFITTPIHPWRPATE
jgi:hypothetical protein